MKVATVLKKGKNMQVVNIPPEYHFTTKEVWIEKRGKNLLVKPKSDSWNDFFLSSLQVSEDFSMERDNELPQK